MHEKVDQKALFVHFDVAVCEQTMRYDMQRHFFFVILHLNISPDDSQQQQEERDIFFFSL